MRVEHLELASGVPLRSRAPAGGRRSGSGSIAVPPASRSRRRDPDAHRAWTAVGPAEVRDRRHLDGLRVRVGRCALRVQLAVAGSHGRALPDQRDRDTGDAGVEDGPRRRREARERPRAPRRPADRAARCSTRRGRAPTRRSRGPRPRADGPRAGAPASGASGARPCPAATRGARARSRRRPAPPLTCSPATVRRASRHHAGDPQRKRPLVLGGDDDRHRLLPRICRRDAQRRGAARKLGRHLAGGQQVKGEAVAVARRHVAVQRRDEPREVRRAAGAAVPLQALGPACPRRRRRARPAAAAGWSRRTGRPPATSPLAIAL